MRSLEHACADSSHRIASCTLCLTSQSGFFNARGDTRNQDRTVLKSSRFHSLYVSLLGNQQQSSQILPRTRVYKVALSCSSPVVVCACGQHTRWMDVTTSTSSNPPGCAMLEGALICTRSTHSNALLVYAFDSSESSRTALLWQSFENRECKMFLKAKTWICFQFLCFCFQFSKHTFSKSCRCRGHRQDQILAILLLFDNITERT